jgi:hypothetical protein
MRCALTLRRQRAAKQQKRKSSTPRATCLQAGAALDSQALRAERRKIAAGNFQSTRESYKIPRLPQTLQQQTERQEKRSLTYPSGRKASGKGASGVRPKASATEKTLFNNIQPIGVGTWRCGCRAGILRGSGAGKLMMLEVLAPTRSTSSE